MKSQKELVRRKDYDFLIVLDACRYDIFSELCKIGGSLRKVESPAFSESGAATSVWYREIFREKWNDTVCISSHPRVNSSMEVEGFCGGKHFSKVYDLWDSEWNKEKGTVLPERVVAKSLQVYENKKNKRFLIHFMQPHTPYLTLDLSVKKGQDPKTRKSLKRKIRNFLVSKMRNFFGDETAVNLMDLIGFPPLSPMDEALRKVGAEGVKKAYKENLVIVLDNVENFIDRIDGKCVVTSDHGELLGEYGRFGHEVNARPELVQVPWLEFRG